MQPLTWTPVAGDVSQGDINNQQNTYNSNATGALNASNAIGAYQKTMQSGTDMYGQQLAASNQNAGYNPAELAAAQNAVSQTQGIIGGLPRAVQASNANYGATAGDVASQVSSEGANLNQTLGLANQNAANQQARAGIGLTGAQNATTAGLQGQQNKLTALQSAYTSASNVRDSALKQLQYLQGKWQQNQQFNSNEAQLYQQANAAIQSSNAAMLTAQGAYKQAMANANAANQQATGYAQANAIGARNSAYGMSANNSGGFNYTDAGSPITVQQYNTALGRPINQGADLGQNSQQSFNSVLSGIAGYH